MGFSEKYDVVVVGAGHAGCEAAMAAARMGLKTALYTINLDLIAQMSCNPAVGGIAKGHLVREIDALGGVMGEVIDAVGIQFRLLNTSRGPAVWSPRAQADKKLYRAKMRQVLESEPNLRIKQAEVIDLVLEDCSAGILPAHVRSCIGRSRSCRQDAGATSARRAPARRADGGGGGGHHHHRNFSQRLDPLRGKPICGWTLGRAALGVVGRGVSPPGL